MKAKANLSQWLLNIFFIFVAGACLLPFLLLFMSSITDQKEILQSGYSFFPKMMSMSAYNYLFRDSTLIFRAYSVSIFVTVFGTIVSLTLISLLAYPLSRRDYPLRTVSSFFVFFTMLFNGGLVPTYLVYTQLLDLKNTIWALIIPYLLLNGFYVLLARTFFSSSIPVQVIESAYIDGAGEFKIFYRIVLPLSLPVLATIGLFQTINYWNDWFNSLIFITDSKLFSLQYMLNKILLDIQFLNTANLGGEQGRMISDMPTETVRMAMAVIGILPIIISYPFFQKYFVKGLTIGAVKG